MFHEVVEDEPINNFLGEWEISHDELYFGKKIVDHNSHQIYHGKWHGDVVLHSYQISKYDRKSVEVYYEKVKALMHIRHENIVSFMGASTSLGQDETHLKSYLIVTNPVRAESLFATSDRLNNMFVATKMSIACQVIRFHKLKTIHITYSAKALIRFW